MNLEEIKAWRKKRWTLDQFYPDAAAYIDALIAKVEQLRDDGDKLRAELKQLEDDANPEGQR